MAEGSNNGNADGGKEDFVCDICGNVFANQTYLRRHKKDRHTEFNEEHTKCPKCSVIFKDLKTFWNHIVVKHEAKYKNDDFDYAVASEVINSRTESLGASSGGNGTGGESSQATNNNEAIFKRKEPTSNDTEWVNGTECRMCDKKFSNTSGLRRHLKGVHLLDWKTIKDGVDKDGANSSAINDEDEQIMKTFEAEVPEFFCVVCDLEFVSAEGEARHNRSVHGIIPESELPADVNAIKKLFSRKLSFRCKECGEKFLKLSRLQEHFLEVHKDDTNYLTCSTCDLEFTTIGGITRHNKNVHDIVDPDAEDDNCPVRCSYCPRVVAYKLYKLHVRESHNEHYKEVVQYLNKKESEGDSEPATCKICRKTFCDEKTLKKHVVNVHTTHSSEFSCFECGKEFKNSGGLRDHLGVHQKLAIEPYVKAMLKEIFGTVCNSRFTCGICQTQTISSFEARIHVYVKHPEKFNELVTVKAMNAPRNAAFPCPVCDEHFLVLKDVIGHIENSHPETEVPTCNVCGHKELKERDMNLHYQRYHPNASRHVCQICQATFKQGRDLRLHIKRDHSEESLQCPYCPEKHIKLKLHVTVKHPDKAEEYRKLVEDAIREEVQARVEFNQLIDGSGPRIKGKKKKKKKKKKRVIKEETDFIEEDADHCEGDQVKANFRMQISGGSSVVTPIPAVPPEPYKMEKKVDKHLIEVHRLSPPPAPAVLVQPSDPSHVEEDMDTYNDGNDLMTSEQVDVKPRPEDLILGDETSSNSNVNAKREPSQNSTTNLADPKLNSSYIRLKRLTEEDVVNWRSSLTECATVNPEADPTSCCIPDSSETPAAVVKIRSKCHRKRRRRF